MTGAGCEIEAGDLHLSFGEIGFFKLGQVFAESELRMRVQEYAPLLDIEKLTNEAGIDVGEVSCGKRATEKFAATRPLTLPTKSSSLGSGGQYVPGRHSGSNPGLLHNFV